MTPDVNTPDTDTTTKPAAGWIHRKGDKAPAMRLVLESLDRVKRGAGRAGPPDWGRRHAEAWIAPRDFERPIVDMVSSLARYADSHRVQYESSIGDDGVLGPCWKAIAEAIIGLLNGQAGRLDCGTVDALVRDMAAAEGLALE